MKVNAVIASRKEKRVDRTVLQKNVKAPEDYPKAPGAGKRNNPPGDMGGMCKLSCMAEMDV